MADEIVMAVENTTQTHCNFELNSISRSYNIWINFINWINFNYEDLQFNFNSVYSYILYYIQKTKTLILRLRVLKTLKNSNYDFGELDFLSEDNKYGRVKSKLHQSLKM